MRDMNRLALYITRCCRLIIYMTSTITRLVLLNSVLSPLAGEYVTNDAAGKRRATSTVQLFMNKSLHCMNMKKKIIRR